MKLDLEQAAELIPQFLAASLPPEQHLAFCSLLTASPELMEQLRLALALKAALQADTPEPPPFPQAIFAAQPEKPRAHPLLPPVLSDSLLALKSTASLTKSAIKLALKLI